MGCFDVFGVEMKKKHCKRKKSNLSPRDARLKRIYGLAPGEYEKILEYQLGNCYICKRPPKEGKNLHVDHNHKTGLTRGLLCWIDNAALGKFRDSEMKLTNALRYIQNPPAVAALGKEVFGRVGRVTNKRKKRSRRRKR